MRIAIASFSSNFRSLEEEINFFKLFSKDKRIIFFYKKNTFLDQELSKGEYSKFRPNLKSFNFEVDWSPFFLLALRAIIVKNKIDTLILFNILDVKLVTLAIKGLKVRLILRQDVFNMDLNLNLADKHAMERVDAFVPASHYMTSHLQLSLDKYLHNIKPTMIYSYIDYDQNSIQESYEEKNKFIDQDHSLLELLHIGDIEPSRGQYEALLAAKFLKDQGCVFKLTFVGNITDDAYYHSLQLFLKNYHLATAVNFVAHDNATKDFYQKAHILLCSSNKEGQTSLYVDAMLHGLPILAFESSVLTELKLLGLNVYLANDQHALNLKLMNMVNSIKDVLKSSMKDNISIIKKYFSSEIIIKQWMQLIKSL